MMSDSCSSVSCMLIFLKLHLNELVFTKVYVTHFINLEGSRGFSPLPLDPTLAMGQTGGGCYCGHWTQLHMV